MTHERLKCPKCKEDLYQIYKRDFKNNSFSTIKNKKYCFKCDKIFKINIEIEK